MRRLATIAAFGVAAIITGSSVTAQPVQNKLEAVAAQVASRLAAVCPAAKPDDLAAYTSCAAAMRHFNAIPFSKTLVWGGDQPARSIKKKQLTDFHSEIFQQLYLSLFSFTGKFRVGHDARDDIDFIAAEGFFRNGLAPGEYPYPFWHSADKWSDYEQANEVKFYLDPDGHIFVATRSHGGSEANRGVYAHREPPVFDGKWVWQDEAGKAQPHVTLFSSQYSPGNPHLKKLDKLYTDFALQLRDGSCIRCHAPNNRSGMDRLVLLQTPAHAASEIDEILKTVNAGDMPQNDWGAKKPLDPKLRTALLTTGRAFRNAIAEANAWEGRQKKP